MCSCSSTAALHVISDHQRVGVALTFSDTKADGGRTCTTFLSSQVKNEPATWWWNITKRLSLLGVSVLRGSLVLKLIIVILSPVKPTDWIENIGRKAVLNDGYSALKSTVYFVRMCNDNTTLACSGGGGTDVVRSGVWSPSINSA